MQAIEQGMLSSAWLFWPLPCDSQTAEAIEWLRKP